MGAMAMPRVPASAPLAAALLTAAMTAALMSSAVVADAQTASRPSPARTARAAGTATGNAPGRRDTRLVDAVKGGDGTAALALLQSGANANSAEPDGTTALHWAARTGDAPLVDRLLRAGANATAANRYEVTPIALACQSGSAAIVSSLLKAGVSANAAGPLGETALMTCARSGSVEAVKILIAQGASVDAVESWRGQTALMWAAAQGHPQVMTTLIKAGADVNARSVVIAWERQRTKEPREKWLPPGGLTPLLLAARQGCLDCAKVLIEAGADANVVDPQGNSALLLAAINGHFDVAKFLVQSGTDANLADETGQTPLYAVIDMSSMPVSNRPAPQLERDVTTAIELATALLERGANPNVQLREMRPYRTKLDRGGDGVLGAGTTPLLRAAKGGDVEALKLLIAKGADPTVATRNGVNAVMMAAGVGTREEDTTGRNKSEAQIIETIALLAAVGVDVNAVDTQGRTAAHGAAMWGLTDVVTFLHQKGARLDAKDKRGMTPLDAAMGLVGGLGFDGKTGTVHEKTARAIRDQLGAGGATASPSPSR